MTKALYLLENLANFIKKSGSDKNDSESSSDKKITFISNEELCKAYDVYGFNIDSNGVEYWTHTDNMKKVGEMQYSLEFDDTLGYRIKYQKLKGDNIFKSDHFDDCLNELLDNEKLTSLKPKGKVKNIYPVYQLLNSMGIPVNCDLTNILAGYYKCNLYGIYVEVE